MRQISLQPPAEERRLIYFPLFYFRHSQASMFRIRFFKNAYFIGANSDTNATSQPEEALGEMLMSNSSDA